jgi:hypothetical protein
MSKIKLVPVVKIARKKIQCYNKNIIVTLPFQQTKTNKNAL